MTGLKQRFTFQVFVGFVHDDFYLSFRVGLPSEMVKGIY